MSEQDRISALEAQLAAQAARFQSLRDTALALGSTLDMDELQKLIMREVTQAMGAARSTLFLCDDGKREIWSKIAQGSAVKQIRVRFGEGIAGHVAATGERLNIADAYADPRFQKEWDQRTGFRTTSVLCEPIRNSRGTIIGVIQVMNKERGPFSAEDEALLAALASQSSIALENSKLFQKAVAQNEELLAAQRELERKAFELEFLFQVEQKISRADAESEVIERVIDETTEIFGAEAGSVVLCTPAATELFFRYATGQRREAVQRFRLPLGRGIAGWVARHGLPILCNDPTHEPRHHWPIADAIAFPARNILCVPLLGDEATLGAVELINKRSADFTEADLKLLSLVAGLVAKAIQQARHREAQEKANRLADLGQALSGVLHDFKTPMTAIAGYVQLMAGDVSSEDRARYGEAVARQFEHMGTMMREVLAFARGESNVLYRKVFVQSFLDEVAELLAPEFAGRNIEFAVETRYRGTARFDEGKMRRVFHNIARNAIEAMGGGGRFTISADREGEELVFIFSDTGPGVPEEIRDNLFESFVSRGKVGGTGLGLAIVKKIVGQHRGQIEYQTEPGHGTTFYCRIPIEPGAEAPQ
jgi:signal transduction histidine kinase